MQCYRYPPHERHRKDMRKPLSVIPIIHIYEFQKHHLLNLLTLHAYSGKDREMASKRDSLLKYASWGGFLNGIHLEETCFGGCLFIRDYFNLAKYTVEPEEDDSFWLVCSSISASQSRCKRGDRATFSYRPLSFLRPYPDTHYFLSLYLSLSPSHLPVSPFARSGIHLQFCEWCYLMWGSFRKRLKG